MPRFENADFSIFRVFLGPNEFLCLSNLRVHSVLLSLCCFAVLQTIFVFFHVAEVR